MNRSIPIYFSLLLLKLFLVTGCTQQSYNQNANVESHKHSAQGETKKEIWTCAMHPQIQKEGPGLCPICGMNLVKVEPAQEKKFEGQTGMVPKSHAAFYLSRERQQMIGVKTGFAEKKPLFKSIRVAGRLAYDPELYTAQNEYAEALKQLERVKDSPLPDVQHSAEKMLQSAKLRLKILGLADPQIDRIKSGAASESSLLINTPGSQVWVYADIYEMDLQNVQPGQSAEVSASFLGGTVLAGKVVSVDRVINPNTRTAKARIQVQQANTFLRPESYVDVTILAPLGEQVTVPFDAILDTGKQAWVFVVGSDGQFTPRIVTVKLYAGDEVAIGNGLKGGEKIVTSANFLIDSESRLKAVTTGLAASDHL